MFARLLILGEIDGGGDYVGEAFEIQAPVALAFLNLSTTGLDGLCILGCMLAFHQDMGGGSWVAHDGYLGFGEVSTWYKGNRNIFKEF